MTNFRNAISRALVIATGFLALGTTMLAGRAMAAERSMNCIPIPGSFKDSYILPADDQWYTITSTTTTIESPSHLVISASVSFSEGNVAYARYLSRLLVDGQPVGPVLVRRVPEHAADTQDMRGLTPNIAAGDHTFEFQLRNQSGGPIYFFHTWSDHFLVDAFHASASNLSSADISVGGAWTTVQELQIAVSSNRMLQLGSTFRVSPPGDSSTNLRVRFFDATSATEVVSHVVRVPAVMTDSYQFAHFYLTAPAGTRTLQLQIRNIQGSVTRIRSPYLYAVEMPRYHVFNAGGVQKTLPNDGDFHEVVGTGFEYIPASSTGYKNWGFTGGVAFFTMPGQMAQDLMYRLQVYGEDGTPLPFDIGMHDSHTTGRAAFGSDFASGCGKCGWNPTKRFKVQLDAAGLCPAQGSVFVVAKAISQVVIVPSNPFFDADCGKSWKECCQDDPNCTYICEGPTPALGTTSSVKHRHCP